MLLACRFLIDVAGVNSFEYSNSPEWYEGDSQTLYMQLIDASLDRPEEGFVPAGRRYIPASGAILTVTLMNIDTAKVVERIATQPYQQDGSIWRIEVLPTDPLKGTINVKLKLVEGTSIKRSGDRPNMIVRVR
jgi:hypothetical protein